MNETGEFSTLLRDDRASDDAGAAFLLSVVEGPDRGASLLVDASLPSRAFAGTSSTCELRLNDHDVSRRHVAFEVNGEMLRVTDLDSARGTTANGIRVLDAFMRGGEMLHIGRTGIRVERAEPLGGPRRSRAERFGRIIGASPEMQRLYPLGDRVAATKMPVIIEGETGTGKELFAEAIHELGPRASHPFVVLDCLAGPRDLRAVFERADGGTLVVDEIADLDPNVQEAMLGLFERDVRLVLTTRRDLDRAVDSGFLREDLFERTSIARIELPPLRRRTGDVRRLALHFAREIGGPAATLPPELVARYEDDPWPGNVRALRDAVATFLALDDQSGPTDFDALFGERVPFVQARQRVASDLERRWAERMLAEHGGDATAAAEASGIARRHFAPIIAR